MDETRAGNGAEATNDEEKADVTKAGKTAEETTGHTAEGSAGHTAEDTTGPTAGEPAEEARTEGEAEESAIERPSGVGQGAGAVVSAALGIVSLTGNWVGTVAAARQTLIGQLQTSSSASVAKQIKAVYGDAWHTTALWGGLFALAALLVGVVVLVRPAFGAPGKPQDTWVKSVAWAGVSLGVVGLLLAVLKYSDVLLALPSGG